MDSFSCRICLSNYDTLSKLPHVLPKCGHSLCLECLTILWKKNPEVVCPWCQEASVLNEVNESPVNWEIKSGILKIQIYCDNHPDRVSIYFDKNSIQCLCSECAESREQRYLKGLEDRSDQYFLNKIGKLYTELKPGMTADEQRFISNAKQDSTSQKYIAYKKLLQIANNIKCDMHKDKQATLVNPEKGRTFCESCVMPKNSQYFVPISKNHELKLLLSKRIQDLIEELPLQDSILIKRGLTSKHKLLKQLIEDIKMLIARTKPEKEEGFKPFNSSMCEICKENYIFPEKYPVQITCEEKHVICNICFSEKVDENNPQCPITGEILLELSPLKIFPSNFEAPKCPECKKNFNLEFHMPRVLPCNKVLCAMCINEKNQLPCNYCKEIHIENYHPISKFFCDLVIFSQIKCDLHRGLHASYYQKSAMMFACEECNRSLTSSQKVWDNGENVSNLLKDYIINLNRENGVLERIGVSAQDLEDGKYSNQTKIYIIKHIRSGRETPFMEYLKGREILQNEILENSTAVLYRFLTVMPPQNWDGECIFPYKPWFIDTNVYQIDALTFKAGHRIKISGLGICIPLDRNENFFIEHIAIFEGETSMRNPDNIVARNEHFIFKEFVQDIYFFEKVEIPKDTYYTIQIKINANFLYRGNPLDKPEFAVGSDCIKFDFKETIQSPDTVISSQNDIHGPIIKIYYDKVKED